MPLLARSYSCSTLNHEASVLLAMDGESYVRMYLASYSYTCV